MSNTLTYTVKGDSIIFRYPTLTVTEVPVLAGRKDLTISVRKIYGVRAIVLVSSPDELDTEISRMQQLLSAPGGTLTIDYDGWGDQLNVDSTKDLLRGPRPIRVEITKVYGGNAALVFWEVETEMFPTPSGYSGEEGKWVDLVYTISTTIDQNYFATRTISGLLRLNKQYTTGRKVGADSFRKTITNYFKIPRSSAKVGFWQRMEQRFSTDETDTILRFTIIDKQRYSWLPPKITRGDFSVSVTSQNKEREGVVGTFTMDGFFEATDRESRTTVALAVLDLLNMFGGRVLERIKSETLRKGKKFWVEEKSHSYTFYLTANRVDFHFIWDVFGQFSGGLVPNLNYTAGVALEWLAWVTRTRGKKPQDLGPYGTSGVCGLTGGDIIHSPVLIDFEVKASKHSTAGLWISSAGYGGLKGGTSGGTEGSREHTTKSEEYIAFHQSFEYKVDQGLRAFPVMSKTEGGKLYTDVVQQVSPPQVFLLIVGEAKKQGTPPEVPLPPYPLVNSTYTGGAEMDTASPKAILISSSVNPSVPTGFGRYKLSWRFVLKLVNVEVPSNVESGMSLRWPWTPKYEQTWAGNEDRAWQTWSFPK